MTAVELFRRARRRGYHCPQLTAAILKKWLRQQVTAGLLEQRGDRFYLTHDGREVAASLAGGVVRRILEAA